jgi:hypothetical protein
VKLQLVERVVQVKGRGVRDGMATPRAGRFVSRWVEESLRRSTRMRVVSISRKVGRPESVIRPIWEIFEKGWSQDGLVYCAPTIKEAAPKLLEQPALFGEPLNPDDTAFEYLLDAVVDVQHEVEESSRYDTDLLEDFARMKGAGKEGVEYLAFPNVARTTREPADKALADHACLLLEKTPDPQRVRIVGRLDMVRVSESSFELLIKDGQERLRGVWVGSDPERLGHYITSREPVAVDGDLIYKPNGKQLRLEAMVVRPAEVRDAVFTELPSAGAIINELRLRNRGALTIGDWIGTWPGDETDEELTKLLETLR